MDEITSSFDGSEVSTAEGSRETSSGSRETSSILGQEVSNTSFSESSDSSSEISTNNSSLSETFENEVNRDMSETSSQELAENAHNMTKEDMIREHGHCMSEDQISMLESDDTKENLNVLSAEDYTTEFPDQPFEVVGSCDSEGNIYIKDISPEAVDHISTHETMHLCANREVNVNDDGDVTIISGLHESEIRSNGEYVDSYRGINEGTTEMYTLRELNNRGETEAANSMNSYSEARMWSSRMESLVGKERVEAAYFGKNREGLKQEFNRLNNGNPYAWDSFSRDVDILEYSRNPREIDAAKYRLAVQYRTMATNKYGLKEW